MPCKQLVVRCYRYRQRLVLRIRRTLVGYVPTPPDIPPHTTANYSNNLDSRIKRVTWVFHAQSTCTVPRIKTQHRQHRQERETETERQRQTETDRDRQTDRQTETETKTGRQRQTDRREREKERERERELLNWKGSLGH